MDDAIASLQHQIDNLTVAFGLLALILIVVIIVVVHHKD